MAIPLFIFAVTISHFIKDQRFGSPERQLEKVMKYQMRSQKSKLDATYPPVLGRDHYSTVVRWHWGRIYRVIQAN